MKANLMPERRLGPCPRPKFLRAITLGTQEIGDMTVEIVGAEYEAAHDWRTWPGDSRYEACSRCGEQRRVNQSPD